MSKFRELRLNAPKLAIKGGAREVIFKTVSCMCDNVGHLTFKKNGDNDFKMNGNGSRWIGLLIKTNKTVNNGRI